MMLALRDLTNSVSGKLLSVWRFLKNVQGFYFFARAVCKMTVASGCEMFLIIVVLL